MKKHVAIIVTAIGLLSPLSAFASYSRSPGGSTPIPPIVVTISGADSMGYWGSYTPVSWDVVLYHNTTPVAVSTECVLPAVTSQVFNIPVSGGVAVTSVQMVAYQNSDCTNLAWQYSLETSNFTTGVYVAPPAGLSTVISNASSTIVSSLGFGLPQLTSFMSGQFLLIMGGGLGMLQGLMVYIVFLAIATGVIYFLYRAFTFFRH